MGAILLDLVEIERGFDVEEICAYAVVEAYLFAVEKKGDVWLVEEFHLVRGGHLGS